MTLEELYRLLRTSHVQSQGVVDTLEDPLVVLDKSFTVLSANPAFFRAFHVDREATLGRELFALGSGQWDVPELRRLLADVVPKATAILGYEVDRDFPDIGRRTILVSARQLLHPDNNSTQMLVVFEDVTERYKADANKDVLLAETRHRMKNLLAVLRGVARQTEAKGLTGEEYRDVFMGRFEAVLKAQEIITTSGYDPDLAELLHQSVQSVVGSQLVFEPGPAVNLTEHQVLPLTMILHELTTNATKYGALSVKGGLVHLAWNTERREGQTRLLLDWREEGGPPVAPPKRRGFGSELIDHGVRAEGGDVAFDFDRAGLRVHISWPLR